MNLTELERSQLESILHNRCEAIADSWYKAVVRTSFAPHDTEVTIQQFIEWTEQVIEL